MSDNPLRVSLENIIPLTEARDHFSQIVNEVQKDKLYVLTKGGKPAVAIIDVKYLEQITGGNVNPSHVETEIQKNPAKVGRVEMISHATTPPAMPIPTPAPKPFTPTPMPPPPMPPAPKPPTAAPTPPPITPTPKPASTPVVPSTPVTPSTLPPNSTPPPPPAPTPVAKIETSFSTTPAQPTIPAQPATTQPSAIIDMHPIADIDDQEKDSATHSDNDRVSPEDKPNPAQYSANSDNVEPDDMAID